MTGKHITIKDVAKYAGVAIGTVDRVLNGKGKVSDKKRDDVLRAVRELDYKPNKIARALSKCEEVRILLVYPDVEKYFWEQINNGVKRVEKRYEFFGLKVIRGFLGNYNDAEEIRKIEQLINECKPHGLAFVPVHTSRLNNLIDSVTESGIPVITFDSDAPKSKRLCFIGEDNVKGGRIAGKLMALFLGGKGRVAVMRAQRDLLAIQQRISGFTEKIATEYPDIETVRFYDMYDMYDNEKDYEEQIYGIVREIADRNGENGIDGIFVTNVLVNLVGKALKKTGNKRKIKVVGFDYSDELGMLIDEEFISATIYTDAEQLGYQAIKVLYEYITEGRKPDSANIYLKYEIMIKEMM